MKPPRVLIVQAMCKQYRLPLFERMHEKLAADGIELHVAYSEPGEAQRRRNDDVDLPPRVGIKLARRSLFGDRVCWQFPAAAIMDSELVVVEHALKHALNYPLMALSRLGLKKLGFWVHGGTLRNPSSPLLRPYRRWSMTAADWIFAYTQGVADAALKEGALPTRTTALNNAIDLSTFRRALAAVSADELAALRTKLGLPSNAQTALFCGSLYPGRGVDFLIEAGDLLARSNPRFHMLVLGAGPLAPQLTHHQATRPWLHPLGSVFGDQRAIYFRLAQLCFMPYLAGLGILDAMAAGLPYLVTGARSENPEIEYLVDGVTGLVTGDDAKRFATAAGSLLDDTPRRTAMAEAARSASLHYSIENMASNFSKGIGACLAQPGRGLLQPRAQELTSS